MKASCACSAAIPTERNAVMQEVCFIADVAVLPPWLKVSQALDYVGGVHPRFDRAKAEAFLAKTNIPRDSRVHKLSKGMITQLHLALVMAIDARLLVLDEPTLGLDILYRKAFYDTLLNDYFDHSRTILVTTHQVEEIQHVLTDVMFINKGRLVLDCSMEDFEAATSKSWCGPSRPPQRARSSRCTSDRCSAAACSCSTPRPCPDLRARRGAHPQHCRPVRRHDRRTARSRGMNAATETSESFAAPSHRAASRSAVLLVVRASCGRTARSMIAPLVAGGSCCWRARLALVAHPGDFEPLATAEPEQLRKLIAFSYVVIG